MKTDIKKNFDKRHFSVLFHFMFILFNLSFGISANAETSWPKVIKAANGEITVYQPQPESLDGTKLSGRGAVSVKHKDAKSPTFGAYWASSSIVVDRDSRIAVLKNIKVENLRFSDELDSAIVVKISKMIEEEMPKWNLEISMDDLITTLETSAANTGKNYKNDAPEIIVTNTPSILVFIDGEPIMKKMENSDFQRIENTPFFIIYDQKKKEYYIYSETHWVTSTDLKGKWEKLKKDACDGNIEIIVSKHKALF
jgi:hypothetical protein